MGRGVSDIIMHECAGERLHATAACAVRVGAARHCNRSALSPGQADPPHFERVQRAVPPDDRRHDDRHEDRDEFRTSVQGRGLYPLFIFASSEGLLPRPRGLCHQNKFSHFWQK